jgi:hypothetical protein
MSHGATGTPMYNAWKTMRARCRNPNNKKYPRYGGRGITICERWDSFENFRDDMGERPEGATLDRIDNDGNYEPENCRWTCQKKQQRNRGNNHLLTIYGKTMSMAEWHEIVAHDTNYHTILQRVIRLGWSHKEAVFGKSKVAS